MSRAPGGRGAHVEERRPLAVTPQDLDSLLPGRPLAMGVVEQFFRSQFEACLEQAGVEENLESCLVFGPNTFADLRRLALDDDQPAAGQQGYPALQRFCQEHDIASKQYLLLPLLTPSHGSLLVLCKPVERAIDDEIEAELLRDRQLPLILHLDSQCDKGPPQAHQPDFSALVRFLLPYLAKDEEARHAWKRVTAVIASVPQQAMPGLGATFMCTNALYFTANLPPHLDRAAVKRLKSYKLEAVDLFEDTPHCYPGFLTADWYPAHVPDSLRKLLLSECKSQLLRAGGDSGATEGLLVRAREVEAALAKTVPQRFEMPEERRASQQQMKQGRRLRAGRRYWEQQGGWTAEHEGSEVTCKRGVWSVHLTEQQLRSGGLRFADLEADASCPQLPPKPQQFDFCFGKKLAQGQQPPAFTVHIPRLLLSARAARAVPREGPNKMQVLVCFRSKPTDGGWRLEPKCWEDLRGLLLSPPRPGDTLILRQQQGAAGKGSSVHVDLELQRSPPSFSDLAAGATDAAEDAAAATSLAALQAGAQFAAGSPAAAAQQATAKGAKRLQTGADGQGDKRARVTIGGQPYYAGYFATGAAAAQAEDFIVMWVHNKALGWQEDWMQECEALEPKLNFPMVHHKQTNRQVLESLSGCNTKEALRQLLHQHLNSDSGAPPSQQPAPAAAGPSPAGGPSNHAQQLLDAVLEAAETQEPAAAAGVGTKRPADAAPAGSNLGCKQQHGEGAAGLAGGGAAEQQQRSQREALLQAEAAEQQQGQPAAQGAQQQAQRAAQQAEQQRPPAPQDAGRGGGEQQQQQQQQEPAAAQQQQQPPVPAAAQPGAGTSSRGGGSWSADARRHAAEALAAAGQGGTDVERFQAQLDGVTAALRSLGVDMAVRLSCCDRFPQLSAMQREALLIALKMIAEEGSPADLAAWLQRAGAG